MTCRWPICFNVLPLLSRDHWERFVLILLTAIPLLASSVTGKVDLRDSREASVRKRLDYSGVVVSLASVNPIKAVSRLADAHVTMRQKDKTFIPHILAIAAGTYVDFPNDDPIFHNAFSNYDGRQFDVTALVPTRMFILAGANVAPLWYDASREEPAEFIAAWHANMVLRIIMSIFLKAYRF